MAHFLVENPTDIINTIRQQVEADEFTVDTAILFATIGALIKKLESDNDKNVRVISRATAQETLRQCENMFKTMSVKLLDKAIEIFSDKNKTRILNDLVLFERWLATRYKDGNIRQPIQFD